MRKRFFKILLVIGLIVVIAAIVVLRIASADAPLPPMPNPNGYDDIIRAGVAISSNFWSLDKMTEAELRAALRTNADAITIGHNALKLECRVRLQWMPGSNSVEEAMAPTDLWRAFAAQGRLAEIEKRPREAMQWYLDTVQLGVKSSEGGLISDELKGIVIQSRGVDALNKLSATLDAKSCAEIAETLESMDARREPMSAYVHREDAWDRKNMPGFRFRILLFIENLPFNYSGAIRRKAAQTYARNISRIRHDMVEIAARAYTLDKGKSPSAVADLVPSYLKAVPKNPTNGMDMTLGP